MGCSVFALHPIFYIWGDFMFSVTGSDRKFFFALFRIVFVFLSVFVLVFYLVSCAFVSADVADSSSVPADSVDSSIVSATSCTVGKFTDNHNRVDVWIDPDTGVNYLLYVWYSTGFATSVKVGGMSPRYNADGSLMVSEGVS